MIKIRRATAKLRRYDEGRYRFCGLAGSWNYMDKRKGVLQRKMTTKDIKDEFFKRHPDMLFHDDDGSSHLMTLTSGPNQISIDRIIDKLPDGNYAPHTFDNIRFVPVKLNVLIKASTSQIKQHQQSMESFVCPVVISLEVLHFIRRFLYGARSTSKRNLRPERGITVDPSLTAIMLCHKFIRDQKMICAISGLPMLMTLNSPFTASMDRICNTLGYTYENTQFVCRFKQYADGNVRKRKGESLEQTNDRRKLLRFA